MLRTPWPLGFCFFVGSLASCGAQSDDPADSPGGDADADTDTDVDVDADSDTDVDSDGDGDAGEGEGEPQGIRERCFPEIGSGDEPGPDYDQFEPVVGSHCSGTNHQDIAGIERVVFLGDSITEGTPPSLSVQFYRSVLAERLHARFGQDVDVTNCSAWGARTDDLLLPPHEQIRERFDDIEDRRTLVVMTVGGNDMSSVAQDSLDGASPEDAVTAVDGALELLREAVDWLVDPAHFPNGVFVVMANVYEFTDGTGDLPSCPGAGLAGFTQPWPDGRHAFLQMNEGIMRIAVETGTDMIFLMESFCGHGFHAGEPDNECFRGQDAETWFDFTCIHPNPTGHEKIADLFQDVIEE